MNRTRYLILRKTPFRDSSLIVSGISPDFGRIDFMLKGARTIGSKKFPVAELFREISVEFRESRNSTLATPSTFEPLNAFDAISGNLRNYLCACGFANFLMKHSRPMLPIPETYQAFLLLLKRLTAESEPEPWLMLAKLVFLHEGGFLPEFSDFETYSSGNPGLDARQNEVMEKLLEWGLEEITPRPALSPNYFRKFSKWVDSLISYHSLD